MELDFLVTNGTNFLRDMYPISYRLVVCHAMYNLIRKEHKNKIPVILDRLHSCLSSSESFNEPGFLEVYKFFMENKGNQGFIVIDRSKGCFPLVLYPNDSNLEHGDRTSAFVKAFQDVKRNQDEIINLLSDVTEWNGQLENRLKELFTYQD